MPLSFQASTLTTRPQRFTVQSYVSRSLHPIEKDDTIISQMEQWSILSNIINYIQYDRHPKNDYDLDIKAIDLKSHRKIFNEEEDRC